MSEEQASETGGLVPQYQHYERQKCFVGHSHEAQWRDDMVNACNHVLPEFGLEPWYADDHFDPTKPLLEKVIELIANTQYGVYDLSYWRKDSKSEWIMPRNVFIELGIAIALNRPTLLLRHIENRVSGLPLPTCLESVSANILEFSGGITLKRILRERLSQWANRSPEEDWWNRYCTFGKRKCEHREAHPHMRQWEREMLRCHVSDGHDADRPDFRGVVEEVLGRFEDVTFEYLDALPMSKGYDFLLCTHCQTVRSTPFAIYRITPQTPAEAFITIGMSLALETQFTLKVPKIYLTATTQDIPSLLAGYEVVVARNDQERMAHLRKFMPVVIQQARRKTWKARPLPFIEVVPKPVEIPVIDDEQGEGGKSDGYRLLKGRYSILNEIGTGSFNNVYRARDIESNQIFAMKILHPEHVKDSGLLARFQRQAHILQGLSDPHIVRMIDYGNDGDIYYIIEEYVDSPSLKYYIVTSGRIEPLRALNYTKQIAEGLEAVHKHGVVHRDIRPQNILINHVGVVKIIDFAMARGEDSATITGPDEFMGTPYYISPEQVDSGHLADTRSDLYSLAVCFFEMLTGHPPFEGDSIIDIVIKHKKDRVPSICSIHPELPAGMDAFFQKALAKMPSARFQTPREFILALEQLQKMIQAEASPQHLISPVNQGYLVVLSTGQAIPLTWELMLVGRQDPVVGVFPEINLGNMKVGRRHAHLRNRGGTFTVEDLKSINKTRLNGVTLKPNQEYPLKNGDILRFADVETRFDLYAMPIQQVVSSEGEDSFAYHTDQSTVTYDANEKQAVTGSMPSHSPSGPLYLTDYTDQNIGKYYLQRLIDRNTHSSIYLAQHGQSTVVLKVLHRGQLTSEQKQDKFYQEVQLLEQLKHPHILSILDAGFHRRLPYIVTEYAPNGSLSDKLKAQFSPRLLPAHEAIDILTQIGQALVYVHEHNILHCDIKPSNILFNSGGQALLADFEIALIVESDDNQVVEVAGTPRYMAPEQFQGKPSKKSDQYALGCVAYELFTGRIPFTGQDYIALAMKHNQEQPIRPRQLNLDVPANVESAILKALEKDPNNRHATVMDFITALGRQV